MKGLDQLINLLSVALNQGLSQDRALKEKENCEDRDEPVPWSYSK
jgi:hypothetical protein